MNYKKYTGLNDDIIKIRTEVFIEEQGFKDEFDDTDETCSHIVLYDGVNDCGKVYVCSVCGFEYFGDLDKESDDYICPICGCKKGVFKKV